MTDSLRLAVILALLSELAASEELSIELTFDFDMYYQQLYKYAESVGLQIND